MKTYSFTVADGRRLTGYKVDAENEEEAKQRFVTYLSFLGAVIVEEIKAEEHKDGE